MTTTLDDKTTTVSVKTVKHIDVNLAACCSEDCSERCSITGKNDEK